MGLGFTVAIMMAISHVICPGKHIMRDRAKRIFQKMDLIGEGKVFCVFCLSGIPPEIDVR